MTNFISTGTMHWELKLISIQQQNIIRQMFLRATNKENMVPQIQTRNTDTLKVKVGQGTTGTLQISQKAIKEPTSDQINIQVLQQQLTRVRQAHQQERKDKWTVTQQKTKLEGQVKVLQIERDNQYRENDKLKAEIKDSFAKMKDVQAKANTQTTDFYTLKNQNTSLGIEVKKLKDQTERQQEKWNQLTTTNQGLENKNRELLGEVSQLRNDAKLNLAEMDLLRRTIWELETENKRLVEQCNSSTPVTGQQVERICKQLQNWKTAFEKKQQQLQTKTSLLHEQNDAMKKTIDQLTAQITTKVSSGLLRTVSLPAQLPDKENQTHVRLFIKEKQIEQLTRKTKQLEEKVESLQLENALLSKKLTEGTVFSPSGYHKYNQVQNAIFKSCELKRETRDLKLQLETKEKQVESLTQKITEAAQQVESAVIQCRKIEAEMEVKNITHQNTVSELSSLKTKLQRQVQLLKTKTEKLQKQCEEKDQIIMNYVNKQRL